LHAIEKAVYATIWKACAQKMFSETHLFFPTLNWGPSSPKMYEIIARRATGFKSVLTEVSQNTPSTLRRLSTELDLRPWPRDPMRKIILIPGGRYVIVLGEQQSFVVYDFLPHYMEGAPPTLLSSFPISHRFIPSRVVASTLAGPNTSRVRLMFSDIDYAW
jgi:hypothetical protein